MKLAFDNFEYLTFDCYGTLINWEAGILSVLRPLVPQLTAERILAEYGEVEPLLQHPYRRYREVLREVVREFGRRHGFTATEQQMNTLPDSVAEWQPYADTVEALRRLKARYKLAVLSNIDDDLFAQSARRLQVPFDEVVTAEQVRSYKPGLAHFDEIFRRTGVSSDRILHCGQSVYHDVVPAKKLGFSTVWVHRAPGFGATRVAEERPDLEVSGMGGLADLATL